MRIEEASRSVFDDLYADPEAFWRSGKAYELLQKYFCGLPIGTLSPLLRERQMFVVRSAVFVASELGAGARPVVLDVLPLMNSSDRYIAYNALEVIMACSGQDGGHFLEIVMALNNEDEVVRRLAMYCIARANETQLSRAFQEAEEAKTVSPALRYGLRFVLDLEPTKEHQVLKMLQSPVRAERQFGAISAIRLLDSRPDLLDAVNGSKDCDLQSLGQKYRELHTD